MKMILYPYSRKFAGKFAKVRNKIIRNVGEIDIHHVGSTAVPNLVGKGIVDILIGVENWKSGAKIVRALKQLGFIHIHPRQNGRIFVSNRKLSKRGDVHVHIVKIGTRQYKDFLKFRDHLRNNKKARDKYAETKREILRKVKGNRKKYFQLKSMYVNFVLRNIEKK